MPNTLIMISYGNAECAVEILLLMMMIMMMITCIVHAYEEASVDLMYNLRVQMYHTGSCNAELCSATVRPLRYD